MNLDEIMGRVTDTCSFKLDSQNLIQSLTSLIKSTLDEVNKQTNKEFFGVGGSAIFRSSEVKKVQEIS